MTASLPERLNLHTDLAQQSFATSCPHRRAMADGSKRQSMLNRLPNEVLRREVARRAAGRVAPRQTRPAMGAALRQCRTRPELPLFEDGPD